MAVWTFDRTRRISAAPPSLSASAAARVDKIWVELITEIGENARASAVGRAQPSRDACPEIGFRAAAGDVHAAVDQAVDERADDLGPVEHLAAASTNIG